MVLATVMYPQLASGSDSGTSREALHDKEKCVERWLSSFGQGEGMQEARSVPGRGVHGVEESFQLRRVVGAAQRRQRSHRREGRYAKSYGVGLGRRAAGTAGGGVGSAS